MEAFSSSRAVNAPSSLCERHFTTVIRRLFDGIDQAVQLDRGREGRLATLAVTDPPGKQRVHLTDIHGFARRRSGGGKGEALWHRDRGECVAALRPAEENLAQLWRILAHCYQRAVPAVDFHAITTASEWNCADMDRRHRAIRQPATE